ncbi:hypothetical protein BV898_18822 [Hypsibius exemplaris]|uniref:Uncharacterized protein n=1 Tax=Hypsibius exemplaris TaxID=2072580 RepID=A0A9X6NKC5_HYPEX|nr:hypothetical protein BV898_18822 [Hypsibius exemplaris]
MLLNRTFNLQIGPAHMLAGGQTENSHIANTFNFLLGTFQPYLASIANPSDDRFLWERVPNATWFDRDALPPNEPPCGFDGLSRACLGAGSARFSLTLGLCISLAFGLAIVTGTTLWYGCT